MPDRPRIETTPERWRATSAFLGRLFGADDPRRPGTITPLREGVPMARRVG